MSPLGAANRREFLAGGLSFAMLAESAECYVAEGPLIPLVPGPEVESYKKAQDRLLAKDQVTARSHFVKLPNPPLSVHVLEGAKGDPVLLIQEATTAAYRLQGAQLSWTT